MNIIEIDNLYRPELTPFVSLSETQLRLRQGGQFVAESPNVVERALKSGCHPVSMLCEKRYVDNKADRLLLDRLSLMCPPSLPVFSASGETLKKLTGFSVSRGMICLFERPLPKSLEEVCRRASRVLVLQNVVDAANVGAMFRTAAALGVGAVALSLDSCDPLNRRCLRASMGGTLQTAWAVTSNPVDKLKTLGFTTVAMALREGSMSVDDLNLKAAPRLAIVMGNEGWGLPSEVIEQCDHTVMIPMASGVDSLNVAAAAAIALWCLRK